MKVNKSRFSAIKQKYELLKMVSAYIAAERQIITQSDNGMADGMDAVQYFEFQQDEFGNVEQKAVTIRDAQINKLEQQLKELEEVGRKLLKDEKYELMREAQELYDRTKSQLNKLRGNR